jgi:hypothetical protein
VRQSLLVDVSNARACMPLVQQLTSEVLKYALNSLISLFTRGRELNSYTVILETRTLLLQISSSSSSGSTKAKLITK